MMQESSKPSPEKSVAELMSQFSATLPLIGAAFFIVAICKEVGYFYVVGLQFMTMLTSSDYLRASIIWLPLNAAFSIIFTFFLYNNEPVFKLKHPSGGFLSKDGSTVYIRRIQNRVVRLLLMVCAIAPIAFLAFEYDFSMILFIPVLFLWVFEDVLKRLFSPPEWLIRSMIVFIQICVLAFFAGISSGKSDMRFDEERSSIRGSLDGSSRTEGAQRDVRVMRFVDRGVFFRSPQTRFVEFLPWDDIKQVGQSKPIHWTEQSGRQLFGFAPTKLPDVKLAPIATPLP